MNKIDQTKQEIVAFFEPAPIEGHRSFFFDSFSLEMNSANIKKFHSLSITYRLAFVYYSLAVSRRFYPATSENLS